MQELSYRSLTIRNKRTALVNSEVVVVSRFRITVRKLKLVPSLRPPFLKWATNDFDPFADYYNSDYEDAAPITLTNGTKWEHKTTGSYRDLGGYVTQIDMSQQASKTLAGQFIKDNIGDLTSSNTISTMVDLVMLHPRLHMYFTVRLSMQTLPSG